MIKNAPLYLVDTETAHLPAPSRTSNRTMTLQTNALYRVHALQGFAGRPIRKSVSGCSVQATSLTDQTRTHSLLYSLI